MPVCFQNLSNKNDNYFLAAKKYNQSIFVIVADKIFNHFV